MLKIAKSFVAAGLVLIGPWLAIFGNAWAPRVISLLDDSEIGLWLELVVPFLPMVCIGFGAIVFVTKHR